MRPRCSFTASSASIEATLMSSFLPALPIEIAQGLVPFRRPIAIDAAGIAADTAQFGLQIASDRGEIGLCIRLRGAAPARRRAAAAPRYWPASSRRAEEPRRRRWFRRLAPAAPRYSWARASPAADWRDERHRRHSGAQAAGGTLPRRHKLVALRASEVRIEAVRMNRQERIPRLAGADALGEFIIAPRIGAADGGRTEG